jgi:hypothetical protein
MDITQILSDGHINVDETASIRAEVYADGQIEEEELRDLYYLKDTAESYVPEFGQLVADATVSFALGDKNTPGEVSGDEAEVLNDLIGADGTTDNWEQLALSRIRKEATSVHPSLMSV